VWVRLACGLGPSTARRGGPKSRGSGGGEGTEEVGREEEERKGKEGAPTGGPWLLERGREKKRTRGLLAWARVAAGLRGKERRGRKRSGPRGRGSRPKREEGEKGRPAAVGLASLLFFLSLFYFFPDFQTQIYLNSDKL
jgi:hypothetical protein